MRLTCPQKGLIDRNLKDHIFSGIIIGAGPLFTRKTNPQRFFDSTGGRHVGDVIATEIRRRN